MHLFISLLQCIIVSIVSHREIKPVKFNKSSHTWKEPVTLTKCWTTNELCSNSW
jgi:hypothetical protein